jgi:chromate transporter
MLLPGPEAQQLAIYIGWLMHRTWGGIVTGAFFVIPSIFVLLALSYVYAAHGNVTVVAGVLSGFKPVVVTIVVEAVLKIGGRALKRRAHYLLAAGAFVAIYSFGVPFPLIVLGAAAVGLAGARFWPEVFSVAPKTKEADAKTEGEGAVTGEMPLVGDEHVPLPSHRRSLKILSVGLALWLLPLAALVAWRGWESLHAQEYRFFTQAALVTFGGAYAVLAYVTQAANSYGWLMPDQAVDGLALAETTPGPLIMVLQFVGFMAGWNNPQGLDQTTSTVVGALVATYTTFLPCFLFIFLGAPYIEVLRDNKNLTGALMGVTAAVVGVILNLALVFGAAVIWPDGFSGNLNRFAAVMSVLSFIALYKFKIDVLWVVLAGGVVGLGWIMLPTVLSY